MGNNKTRKLLSEAIRKQRRRSSQKDFAGKHDEINIVDDITDRYLNTREEDAIQLIRFGVEEI